MDYLITEGYPSAAEKFAMEANIERQPDHSFIEQRVQIRDSIHRGDLQQAIELINDLNPEVGFYQGHIPAPSVPMIRLVSCTTHSSVGATMRKITPSVLSMIEQLKMHYTCHPPLLSTVTNICVG
jgi:LisH